MSSFAQTRAALERLSDERLVVLVGEGDEHAFEELADRYRGPLLRYCRRLSLSPLAAEDALQEALAETWMALRRGTRVREPKAWLYRVAHNNAVDLARRATRERERCCEVRSQPELASEGGLDHVLESRETLEALARLPVLQRQAIVRCAVEGVSHEQLASELGLSVGAVRGLIYRARGALRRALDALIPPPVLAWLTRADVGVGVGGESAGVAETLLRGAALALTVGLVAGAVAIHGSHSAYRHGPAPLASKAFPAKPRVAGATRPGSLAARKVAAHNRTSTLGRTGKRDARSVRPAEAHKAVRAETLKPRVVKAARGTRARGVSPGAATAPAAAAPAAAAHGDATEAVLTAGVAGTGAVSSPGGRAPTTATTTSNKPTRSEDATPAQGAAGTKAPSEAQAAATVSGTAHPVGETVHAVGETVQKVGGAVQGTGTTSKAGTAVGETVHTVGEAVHTVTEPVAGVAGETVQKVGGAVQGTGTTSKAGTAVGETVHTVEETVHAVGETVHTVGETVHTVTEPVAGVAGETVQKVGGAVQGTGTTSKAGTAVGETVHAVGETAHAVGEAVHHVTEPVTKVGETARSVGGLVGP